jgi:hypothetical protein
MEKKSPLINPEEWLKDLPKPTESEAYKKEELILCQNCQRVNPPTRLDCLYCGREMEFDETQSQFLKPILRKAEKNLPGFNLIYLANLNGWDERQISEVAKMTRLDKDNLKSIAEAGKCLPIARAESIKETEIVATRLNEIGIETKIIPDSEFQLETLPKRLRRIDFESEKITLIHFNNDEISEINKDQLKLMVVGIGVERKLESTEKHQKKGENKVLETAEISSDEVLIDIFQNEDLKGYRVSAKGFDFSCLGKEKKLLAGENIKILIQKLKEFAPNAIFDDSYVHLRNNLARVWEVEERNDSRGLKRKSFGSFNKIQVITTSNVSQFTKFSRLQWLINKR